MSDRNQLPDHSAAESNERPTCGSMARRSRLKADSTSSCRRKCVRCGPKSRCQSSAASSLSRELDAARIEANLKDGVLNLRVPKMAHAQPRRIEVTTA